MRSVPSEYLQEIAQTQRLKTNWARQVFPMPEEGKAAFLSKEAKELRAKGYDLECVLAYQTFAPLLAENEAISRYLVASGSPHLRGCLPEVTSVNEALTMASQDYLLTRPQISQLRKMMTRLQGA